MPNSDKLIRLLKMISLIEQRNGATLQALIDECEVCERTVYRDIEALSMGGMPIHLDPESKRYRFTEQVFLKPLTFSVNEAAALLQCIAAFTRDKTPLASELRMAQERIMATLPSERQRTVDQLKDIVDIKVAAKPHDVCSNIFACVQKAMQNKKQLQIQYYTKTREEMTERTIDPYVITFRGKAWYLVAFCHLREAITLFRLDRIAEVHSLPEPYIMPKNFSASAFFEGSWLLEQGEPMRVRLQFNPEAARWVREEQYHSSEQMQELRDGSLIYEVTVSGTREITRWILGFGPAVKVLEPVELQMMIAEQTKGMAELYKKSFG